LHVKNLVVFKVSKNPEAKRARFYTVIEFLTQLLVQHLIRGFLFGT